MRVEGWERLLADYIESSRFTPFAWGSHDCALWAAGWVKLGTGRDFAADWAGQYDSKSGAYRLMAGRGFSGPEAIADAHLSRKSVASALRGDLMLHPDAALGVNFGVSSYFVTAGGLAAFRTLSCRAAWGVN